MQKNLPVIRKQAKAFYKNIGSVYCPYFERDVFFTSKGFGHLRYKGRRKERHFRAQKIRYQLLGLAPTVISKSATLQEFETKRGIKYFGFIAIIKGWKLKVIVRQIGDGKWHFWSVIPNWRTRRSCDERKFVNHTGNLAFD